MSKLWFTIGLPRSGKTTYCDEWVKESRTVKIGFFDTPAIGEGVFLDTTKFPSRMEPQGEARLMPHVGPRVCIGGDNFRQAIHGHAYIPEAEGIVFAHMDVTIRAFLLKGYDVIVDETSTTEATIHRYFKIDPEAVPVWIDTPAEVCIQRAIDTDKPFLVDPIKRMAEQLERLKAGYPENFLRIQDYCRIRQNHDIHV